ncbi:DUF551 domain-containing protein [Sphingobacterium mizutaii]|uniref:DUF551 domain-containing protein n=1 Tax=Sphingobacterium mizutaii TaxID=1010 RepID=UPI0035E3D9BF
MEWTSVKDQLPEQEGEYIVCNWYYVPPLIYSCFFQLNDNVGEFYSSGEPEPNEITHWMSLPNPPQP